MTKKEHTIEEDAVVQEHETAAEREWHFPEHKVTVKAQTLAEAMHKLEKLSE